MLCCLKFLYGGTTSNANIAMKLNQNNIQLDTANMGTVNEKNIYEIDTHAIKTVLKFLLRLKCVIEWCFSSVSFLSNFVLENRSWSGNFKEWN